MSKPYDAATKRLLELRPADWVEFLGLPQGPVSIESADLSTVSSFADHLIRVDAAIPYVFHTELESGKDTAIIPSRLLHYNVGAENKTNLPVISNVVLLHRRSDSHAITGSLARSGPDGAVYLTFRYNVIRVWQLDPAALLSGGLSLLPFAPIAKVKQADVPKIIAQMDERIRAEASSESEEADLWTVTNVLMGLRYNTAFKAQVLRGIRRMRESITYQEILEEGAAEGEVREARRMVLRAGMRRLGMPKPSHEIRVQSVESLTVLEGLLDRVFDVETWDELLRDL